MGSDGQQRLEGGEHGETGQEADHLDGEESDGDAESRRQLRVLPGELERSVVQGQAGQDVILPAHEDSEGEDKVRDEGEEPEVIERLLFHISPSGSLSTLLAPIHWPAASCVPPGLTYPYLYWFNLNVCILKEECRRETQSELPAESSPSYPEGGG